MADNVFEKLDEQGEVLSRIEKKIDNKTNSVNQAYDDDQKIIEFIKTAKRVFIYDGDKSDLQRNNKKKRVICLRKFIFSLIQIATVLFAITVPFMWCALIWDFLIYTFYVIDFIKYKPSAFEIPYDDFVASIKKRYIQIYDDNGILCGNTDEKWWYNLVKWLAIFTPLLIASALFFIAIDLNKIYLYVLSGVCFIEYFIASLLFSDNCTHRYNLYFINDKNSIQYCYYLKEIMTKNNLK